MEKRYRSLPYEIGFWGDMFTIPALSGNESFAKKNDPRIRVSFSESYSEPTPARRWSSYKLYANYNAKKWFEILNLDLEKVAFTEDQISYFLILAGRLLIPKRDAYFIMKGKDEFYLARVTCDAMLSAVDEDQEYDLDRYEINDLRPLHPRDEGKAILVFLYHQDTKI